MMRPCLAALVALAAVVPACTCSRAKEGPDDVGPTKPAPLTIETPADLALPRSSSRASIPAEGVLVFVSRTAVSAGKFGAAPQHVLELGDRATLARDGIDAHYKENPTSIYVVPLGDRIGEIRKELGVSTLTPIVVGFDAGTPYRVFADVIGTIQRVQALHYDLVVRDDADARHAIPLGIADLDVLSGTPPKPVDAGVDAALPRDAPVSLGVRVTTEGFDLRAFNEHLGAGCVPGVGVTLPKAGADFDYTALRACAAKQKARVPDTHDTLVSITGAPEIDAQTVVRLLDALRAADDGTTLFPAASFAVVH